MLTVDFMAKRYGKLPSEIMAHATTFDMTVGQTAVDYENYVYQKEKARAEGKSGPGPVPKLTLEKLRDMMRIAKETADNVSKPKS